MHIEPLKCDELHTHHPSPWSEQPLVLLGEILEKPLSPSRSPP